MSSIEKKMNELVGRIEGGREDQVAEVLSMKRSLKTAMLKKNLKEHPTLLLLLSLLRKREQGYTLLLSNKEDLEEVKRRAIFEARRECRFMLSFFEVDKTIENIERELDYQLSEKVDDAPEQE